MRKKIVAGNWKMNLLADEALDLAKQIDADSDSLRDISVILFPPAIFIRDIQKSVKSCAVGIQNFYPADSGAFTGEISVQQVLDAGCSHVLIGHSERRMYFGETDEFLKRKTDAALQAGLVPVFCCGEPLNIRESGTESSYVKQQLEAGLFHLDQAEILKCIVAYEPVWAIGTGKTASSEQAEEMHLFIRQLLTDRYGMKIAEQIPVLYGGSCNPDNASELFACPNVDGGLIGGAALKADSFLKIAKSF